MPVDFQDSCYWVLLVSGWFCVSKTIIPDAQEHFLTPSPRRNTHLFGGLGLMLQGWGRMKTPAFLQIVCNSHRWQIPLSGGRDMEKSRALIFSTVQPSSPTSLN